MSTRRRRVLRAAVAVVLAAVAAGAGYEASRAVAVEPFKSVAGVGVALGVVFGAGVVLSMWMVLNGADLMGGGPGKLEERIAELEAGQ